MPTRHAQFGWTHANALESHSYLLPALLAQLTQLYERRPVRILDLGCGNGYVANQLALRGHDVIAIDQAEDGVKIGRTMYPQVRFELISLEDDRFAAAVGATVDCVVSLEVIEHLFSPRRLFEQSGKVLRAGGHLILSTPYHGYLKNLTISLISGWDRHFEADRDGGHIKFFSPISLKRMAQASGFTVIRWSGAGRGPWLWKSTVMVCKKSSV